MTKNLNDMSLAELRTHLSERLSGNKHSLDLATFELKVRLDEQAALEAEKQ